VLRHAAVGLQAEIVGEVAQLVALLLRQIDRGTHDVGQQAAAETACAVELLLRLALLLEHALDQAVVLLGVERVGVAGQVERQALDGLLAVGLRRALALAGVGHGLLVGVERGLCPRGHGVELAGRPLTVLAHGGRPYELAHLARVLARDAARDVLEHATGELAGLLELREALIVGPGRERARPVLVVLVEALGRAGSEELATAQQALLDLAELLLAIDRELLDLGLDLLGQLAEVGQALLVVDVHDDGGREVEDLLELLGSDVEQVADPARDALDDPDMGDGRGEFDVAHALTAHLLAGHLDAAALADDALVADALVLPAVALPVLGRHEHALPEGSVLLGLERAVIDLLGLGDLTARPVMDLLGRGEPDLDRIEIVDVDHVHPFGVVVEESRGRLGSAARRRRSFARITPGSRGRRRRARARRRPRRPRRSGSRRRAPRCRLRQPGRPPRAPGPRARAGLRAASLGRCRCRVPRPRAGARRPPRGSGPRRRPRR